MNSTPPVKEKNRRILVIDDNRAIHDDFKKILQPEGAGNALSQAEAELFGDSPATKSLNVFTVDSAYQGQDGVELARSASAAGRPYAMAFVDMRMPPGWDGLETTIRLWEVEPDLQIVICSAFSDYTWRDLIVKIGQSDRLVILKKPFDNVEVLQLGLALTEKWHLLQESHTQMETLQRNVDARTVELRKEVAERKNAEELAQRERRAAEDANRSKSAFLANMSHEIRTPMNGILGMANLLLETELTTEQRDFVETLRQSSETLLTILNDILDFSKIEAGRLSLEVMDFDLWEVVESTIELPAARAVQKKLELITSIGDGVPTRLRGDPHRLRQILLNLLGNAIKFTERGEVFLDVNLARQEGDNADLRFEIHDTGIGIPEDVLPRLFHPFTQADESTTRRYGGTGLGLAICQRLIQTMGGEISVRSKMGQGSIFAFTLPFAKQAPETSAEPVERTDLRGLRALVVDDNSTNRKVLHHQLNRWGVDNEMVAGGAAALETLRAAVATEHPYDLILLDMQMPEMDGLMLADAINKTPDLGSPRMVMLTSLGERLDTAERSQHGLSACLTKPVKHSQLFRCLTTVMRHVRMNGSRSTIATNPPMSSRAPYRSKDAQIPTLGATGRSVSLLIAEDNPVNQKVALLQLKKLGLSADVVGDGRDVLPALRHKHYQLILMDCQMPGMDGFEATRLIRSEEANGHATWPAPVRIIAMTASAMQGDRESCLASGMNDYISKPVRLSELAAAVRRQTELAGEASPAEAGDNVIPMAV